MNSRGCPAHSGAVSSENECGIIPGAKSKSDGRTIREINEELATRINEEALRNPQSPYANKFVGIANGRVVAVADTLDEMDRLLRQAEPDPAKCFFVEASHDYSQVEEIWSVP